VKEEMSTPIQTHDELLEDGGIEEPFDHPTDNKVEPSFEKVPRYLQLPTSQPLEETQDVVGVEAQVEAQHVPKVEDPQIEVPITKPQANEFEAQNKEATMFEEQHIPSTKEFQVEDVQPASIEEEEETPIVKEEKNAPIQTLDEQPQHGDVKEPFEIPMEHEVEPKEVEPSFKEVSKFLELPISQPIEKTQDEIGQAESTYLGLLEGRQAPAIDS
jgi:hypothetical protein